jgi:hypothetical protein
MPDNLRARFPAVTVEYKPREVKCSLVFNQSEIAQGEADARGEDARPQGRSRAHRLGDMARARVFAKMARERARD